VRLRRVVDYRASARRVRAGLGCWRLVLLGVLAAVLAGCGSARWSTTTESRGGDGTGRVITGSSYKVRAGDTLHVIARQAGLDPRKIVEWNQLSSPDRIYVGQVLRLAPPGDGGARAAERPASASAGRAADSTPVSAEPRTEPAKTRPVAAQGVSSLRWQWPTSGRVVQRFSGSDPARKGVKIGGRPGQPILAAESGEVVYSGSGLVGYGPLIIVKHNNNYLSAYGHNRKLLVQQGDQVTRGSRIAEMGLAGGKSLLHFEIRRDGDPVDPLALLPQR